MPLRCSTAAVPSVARISKPSSARRLTGKTIERLSRSATEMNAAPARGQPAERRGLRLGERGREVDVEAHDLAGRAHLRAEHGVDDDALLGAEPLERQHRLLDRDRRVEVEHARVVDREDAHARAGPRWSGRP